MGRARGEGYALQSAGFDAVVGQRRGASGPHAFAAHVEQERDATLLSHLHDPDSIAAAAAAREFAHRLTDESDGLSAPERRILWSYAIGEISPSVRSALMGGLCEHLATRGERDDIEQAFAYVDASAWDEQRAPGAEQVVGALEARMGGDGSREKTLLGAYKSELQAALTIAPENPLLRRLLLADEQMATDAVNRLADDPDRSAGASELFDWWADTLDRNYWSTSNTLRRFTAHYEHIPDNHPVRRVYDQLGANVAAHPGVWRDMAWQVAMARPGEDPEDGYEPVRQGILTAIANQHPAQSEWWNFAKCFDDGALEPFGLAVLDAVAARDDAAGTDGVMRVDWSRLPASVRSRPSAAKLIDGLARYQHDSFQRAFSSLLDRVGAGDDDALRARVAELTDSYAGSYIKELKNGQRSPGELAGQEAVNVIAGELAGRLTGNKDAIERFVGGQSTLTSIQSRDEGFMHDKRPHKLHREISRDEWARLIGQTLISPQTGSGSEWMFDGSQIYTALRGKLQFGTDVGVQRRSPRVSWEGDYYGP